VSGYVAAVVLAATLVIEPGDRVADVCSGNDARVPCLA
jgi:hypothetical protein